MTTYNYYHCFQDKDFASLQIIRRFAQENNIGYDIAAAELANCSFKPLSNCPIEFKNVNYVLIADEGTEEAFYYIGSRNKEF